MSEPLIYRQYDEILKENIALRRRAEAAEAERDDALQSAKHSSDWATQAIADMKKAEAERDERDKLWVEALAELAKVDDERIAATRERDALRKDAARLDHMETLREVWSRRPMRAVTGSEWSMVHEHPIDYTPTLREALDAALAVQP